MFHRLYLPVVDCLQPQADRHALIKRVQRTERIHIDTKGHASLFPEPVRGPGKLCDVAMAERTPDPELTTYHPRGEQRSGSLMLIVGGVNEKLTYTCCFFPIALVLRFVDRETEPKGFHP